MYGRDRILARISRHAAVPSNGNIYIPNRSPSHPRSLFFLFSSSASNRLDEVETCLPPCFKTKSDRYGSQQRYSAKDLCSSTAVPCSFSTTLPAERAIGITGFMNRWDAVKTWAKLASMNFRPPESWRSTSSGEVVKDAAARSFESGKETVEQAAATAAQAAGEAMHKTKEKVKRTVSASAGQEPDAEL
uniref:Uncharacterized protein n=1 Tax=Ananas comosus var. bracteatus TaxID=296719 RepID=A0A6V7QQN6_ANACO